MNSGVLVEPGGGAGTPKVGEKALTRALGLQEEPAYASRDTPPSPRAERDSPHALGRRDQARQHRSWIGADLADLGPVVTILVERVQADRGVGALVEGRESAAGEAQRPRPGRKLLAGNRPRSEYSYARVTF